MTLRPELEKIFSKEQIRMRPIDRIAYASDYSFYRMIPQAVVRPKNIADIQSLLNVVRVKETSITFRASGTSMSGQAVTEGILVDLMKSFSEMQVLDNGERVRVQPGVIAGRINQSLAPYGRRIGPDPSSINAASIGGILANNSGGKSVARKDNAYHTLESMTLVLPNGFVLNTQDEDAEFRFQSHCPEIAGGLMQLKGQIESDPALCKSIRRKTAMRNTVGYSLNAFLDFQFAHEILAHLLIGSEGTLGFIGEAILKTVPIPPVIYNGLLFFKDLKSAGEAAAALIDTGPTEMEFIDPDNIMNPGVILNDDEKVNIKNLKTIPKVYPEIDQCLECGHCEWVCPSRDLTLTPRQQIVVQREIARLEHSGENPDILADLLKNYPYDGIETCAADRMCAVACPIDINTADLTRRLRADSASRLGRKLALQASRHFAVLENFMRQTVRWGHSAQRIFGPKWIDMLIRIAEAVFKTRFPKWNASIPMPPARKRMPTSPANAQVVYFPNCINRIMGSSLLGGKGSIVETFLTVSQRAGISVWLPDDVSGYCCGIPFSSKGYEAAFADMFSRTIEKLWEWSHEGALPVFMDASSCVYTLRSGQPKLAPEIYKKWRRLTILDPIEYIHDHVLPGLNIRKLNRSVAIHPACGMVKLGLKDKLETVARRCAASVTIPLYHGCCGFAGDRGMLFPELACSATRAESA